MNNIMDMNDDDFDAMLDEDLTVAKHQVEVLAHISQQMGETAQLLHAVVQELGRVAQIVAAPREIVSQSRDGNQMKAISRIKANG